MRKPKKKLKLKSHRGAVKRFKLTATGKVKRHQSMKRHLRVHFNLTPAEYRAKWGLPDSFPMTAPDYSARRSELAKANGKPYKARGDDALPAMMKYDWPGNIRELRAAIEKREAREHAAVG